jgi:hypothetical protein
MVGRKIAAVFTVRILMKGKTRYICRKRGGVQLTSKQIMRKFSFLEIPMPLMIDVDVPAELDQFRLPKAVAARLQTLLDR